MRHDFAGEGDVLELIERDGFDEEGDVGFARFDQSNGFGGFPEVLNISGGADLVIGEAEKMVEDYSVELSHT